MDRVERLARDYAPALLSYLGRRDEPALRSAYELGRSALVDGLSLLDLVSVHNAAVNDVVARSRLDEVPHLVETSGTYLVEVLSSFEMARRAFQETLSNARLGRSDAEPSEEEKGM